MASKSALGETTITGRGQVTLPARGLRELGWHKGDRLIVRRYGEDMVVLMRRPTTPDEWVERFSGRLGHVFGDHDEVLAYVRGERASWDERAERIGY